MSNFSFSPYGIIMRHRVPRCSKAMGAGVEDVLAIHEKKVATNSHGSSSLLGFCSHTNPGPLLQSKTH